MTLGLLLHLAAPAWAEGCPESLGRDDLRAGVEVARAAFEAEDRSIFEAALEDANYALGCLDEPLNDREAAALHLVWGLYHWDPADPAGAIPYLSAYAVTFPPHEDALSPLPLGLFEAEAAIFERAAPELNAFEADYRGELPPAVRGRLQVNGQGARLHAPENHPYVLQRSTSDRVIQSAYVHPGAGAPDYPRLRIRLAQVALLSAGASAALSWGAFRISEGLKTWTQDDGFGRHTTEEDYFRSQQQLNHGLIIAGTSMATVSGVSLGVAGLSLVW